jgi:hypothetical protein
MAILLNTPKPVASPDVPFDRVAVTLQITPSFRDRQVGASCVLMAQAYRQLPDGSVDKGPILLRETIGDVFTEAQNRAQSGDASLAVAVEAINTAIQQYVVARIA